MARNRITSGTKVRVVLEGICFQTTAKLLDTGSISTCLYNAWDDFKREHVATGIVGKVAGWHDSFSGKTFSIQFDIY